MLSIGKEGGAVTLHFPLLASLCLNVGNVLSPYDGAVTLQVQRLMSLGRRSFGQG